MAIIKVCDICGKKITDKEVFNTYSKLTSDIDICSESCLNTVNKIENNIAEKINKMYTYIDSNVQLLHHYLISVDWNNEKYKIVFGILTKDFQNYKDNYLKSKNG